MVTSRDGRANAWALLLYKVPPEPTARRVYVWRKLKRLGALLLHDAVWALPATPYTLEQLRWLAAEIAEMDGSAQVWEAHLSPPEQDAALVRQFVAQVEVSYAELLTELERGEADLAALSRRYQQIHAQDYFHAALGTRVREALAAMGGRCEP